MGITKQYLRYAPLDTFNIITSSNANITFIVYQGQEGRYVAVGGCESVFVWDLRLGEKALVIPNDNHVEVTCLAASPDRIHIAVGYSDGKIGITNIITGELKTIFSGHRSAITSLVFDEDGHRLASGSKDTEIVTWDLIAENGIERLSGHKGVITSLVFMKNQNILISSSKDTFIKFWDLDTAFCFHTIAANVTEVWGLALIGEDEYIAAGSTGSGVMIWSLKTEDQPQDLNDATETKFHNNLKVTKAGSVLREGKGRVVSMTVDNSGRILLIHGMDSMIESYFFLSEEESKAKAEKRATKEKKKLCSEATVSTEVTLKDVVRRLTTIKASSKVKSVSGVRGVSELRVAVSLNNNKLELYSIALNLKNKKEEAVLLKTIKSQGHQGEVKAVGFSSDGLAIVSAGSSSVKLWNRSSLQCLRTVGCSPAVSVCFVPGDRHALVGLRSGHLLVVDLSAGEVLEEVPAHTAEIWNVIISPDQTGAITCSGDTTVKLWNFELVNLENSKAKALSVLHTRTLKLEDPVLSVKCSPCGKLIAAALLDSTVKVFFLDTFKFFVSLYGHKMPVTCADISSDSALIITGSSDRNVKIWGLDFGDCHKSLFAHDDSVIAVAFVPDTHYFFTAGKDGKIKEWDADTFNKIITIEAHFGECWDLSLTKDFVVTCGKDKTIRLFEKTQEPLVLSDEQEEEREKEEELATGQDSIVKLPSTKTLSSEKAAELLMECLEIIAKFKEEEKSGEQPTIPPIMGALKVNTPEEYLSKTLDSIRTSDLGEALLLLPLHMVTLMLSILPSLLTDPLQSEMAVKAMLLLIKVHHSPLSADTTNLPLFEKLQETAFESIRKFRDMVGVNLYGLRFLQRDIEEHEGIILFKDATTKQKDKLKRKRKKEIAIKTNSILKL
ncbi:WD repeat-containing protein 3 [Halyomorpha halys]|uniref:WD repeat-containing protein 3 n=1 Tax=Halyomorpha halys TaxID=286706 RepID=UPI0006D4F277|nr:WD repeat-containing protein 3 [Halyomorpha halys]